MSLSLTFTHPILSRHLQYSLFYPQPRVLLFISPPRTSLHRASELPSAAAATASLFQDTAASAAVLAGAYALVCTFDTLTEKQLIQQVSFNFLFLIGYKSFCFFVSIKILFLFISLIVGTEFK